MSAEGARLQVVGARASIHALRRLAMFAGLSLAACSTIVGFGDLDRVDRLGAIPSEAGLNASVFLGVEHSCAVMLDRSVRCWGADDFGQLGIGSTTSKLVPTVVPEVRDVTFLSLGERHTCAVSADSSVRCWGSNESAQLGIGPADTKPHPTPATVENAKAKKVQAGKAHTCIETTTKTVECWGANQSGQLGDGTKDPKSSPTRVPSLAGVEKLSNGNGDYTCAVAARADAGGDAVYCWGINDKGQLGQPLTIAQSLVPLPIDGVADPDKVFVGRETACATLSNTTIFCWGANDHGQLGDGTHDTRPEPRAVTGVVAMIDVSPAFSHTCGTESGGGGIVKCWGSNEFGQLGVGLVGRDQPLPQALDGSGWDAVTTDGEHSCGRRQGINYCWGRNDVGQLGNGTTTDSPKPVPVKF